jgi:hypothetical protein
MEGGGEFGGVCKMEACLEALLEMDFCTKPPNFGVKTHMEAPAGDALTLYPLGPGGSECRGCCCANFGGNGSLM